MPNSNPERSLRAFWTPFDPWPWARPLGFLAALLGVLGVSAPAYPQASSAGLTAFHAERGALERRAVPELETLATWCNRSKLFLERDRAYAMLLRLDPEHPRARRALRYLRRGESWTQSPAFRWGKNLAREAVWLEYEAKLDEHWHPYRSALFTLVERFRGRLDMEEIEDLLRDLLVMQPDDVALRRHLGERRWGDRWVLDETVRALETRGVFAAATRATVEAAPEPRDLEVDQLQLRGPNIFSVGRATERVRVLGTVGAEEVRHTARVTHAVGDLVHLVFGEEGPVADNPRLDYSVFLMEPHEAGGVVTAWPGIAMETRGALQSSHGGWLGPSSIAEWSPDPRRRLDGAARQTLGLYLLDGFGIGGRQGWVWEGVGIYLVHHLVGTRLTWFFEARGYQRQTPGSLWPVIQDPTLDWVDLGRELRRDGRAPSLRTLIGRSVNDMREADLVLSYTLAAYLLEGRPEDAPELFTRLGEGEHPLYAFEGTFGWTFAQIETRFERWLEEMGELWPALAEER